MKKLFTLLAVCLAFNAIGHAQTDGTFIFTDEQGNPVGDGAEITVRGINNEGQMVVPLFVKNVSGQKAAVSLYETIDDKPNGTWQTCAFGNCMVLNETGYSPKSVQGIDAVTDIQTEWIPEEGNYASWKAKLQIHVFDIISQSPFPGMPPIETVGTTIIGYGPTITVNFIYDSNSVDIGYEESIVSRVYFSDYSFGYTGVAPTTTWTKNIDGYTVHLEMPTLNKEVGHYSVFIPATFTKGSESFNANIFYSYTIYPALLTVSAESASREYGEDNPPFALSISGFVNGEDQSVINTLPTFSTTATRTSDVGDYSIIIKGGSADNYSFSYVPGILSVTKAPLSVVVNDTSRIYGEDNPVFQVHYDGLKLDEVEPKMEMPIVFSTNAQKDSPVGEYLINAKDGIAKNYNLYYTSGIFTITPAPLKVIAKEESKLYGNDNPKFDYHLIGKKFNFDHFTVEPQISCLATQFSPVGNYDINIEGGDMPNYELTYIGSTLTIMKRKLEISAHNYSRLYFEDNPIFEVSYSGFADGETMQNLSAPTIIECTATKESPVGFYSLIPSGAQSDNYEISFVSGTLTINKRQLTISTHDYKRKYGEENPSFLTEIEGFVNNEDKSKLLIVPKAECLATITSDVGIYPITFSDGDAINYSFSYKNGKLTIEQAEQEIEWEQVFNEISVGDQIELIATSTSGLPVRFISSDETIASTYSALGREYLDCQKEGAIVLRAAQDGNNNFYAAIRKSKTIIIGSQSNIYTVNQDSIDAKIPIFNTHGQIVTSLKPGHLYIQKGKKFLIK